MEPASDNDVEARAGARTAPEPVRQLVARIPETLYMRLQQRARQDDRSVAKTVKRLLEKALSDG